MLWEHKPQAGVFTAFSSSSKLTQVILLVKRNTENMFSISLENTRMKERKTTC